MKKWGGKLKSEGRMMMKIDLIRETIRLVRDKIGRWQGFLRCCQGTRPDCLANIVVGMRQRSVWAFPPHPGPLPWGEGESWSVSQQYQSPTLADAGSGDPAYKVTRPSSLAQQTGFWLGGVCARDGRAPGFGQHALGMRPVSACTSNFDLHPLPFEGSYPSSDTHP